ncbi:MAG: type II toxin-antitoxin system HipA family toxin [Gemmatimonadaceae bacterium]
MTRRSLAVYLNDAKAGTLFQDPDGQLSFTYDDSWINDPMAYPISFTLPVSEIEHADASVRPYFEGLLPDNAEILAGWGQRFGVSPRNPFDLLEYVGSDCAGAVRVMPSASDKPGSGSADDAIVWLEEAEVASILRSLRDPEAEADGDLPWPAFTLPGMQAKVALLYREGRWGVPTPSHPSTHILKPPTGRYSGFAENEWVCLRLASSLGLPVVAAEVKTFDDVSAFLTTRYDRQETPSSRYASIHQLDCCQALGTPPSRRDQVDGGPGLSRTSKLIRLRSTCPEIDLTTFVQAVAFNWIIGATNAHARNFSVLVGPRSVRLAPLYDIVSVLPYPELAAGKIRMAMKVGGEYVIERIGSRQWKKVARSLSLDETALLDRVRELAAAVGDLAGEVVNEAESAGFGHPILADMREMIVHRAADCVKALTKGT